MLTLVVYTNPIIVYSLFPLTLLALKLPQYLPPFSSVPFFPPHPASSPSSTDSDTSSWRSGLLTATCILGAISILVIYVQLRHHRIFSAIMRRKLARPDMGNIVQWYSHGGVVLVLPVEGELKGVVAVEQRRERGEEAMRTGGEGPGERVVAQSNPKGQGRVGEGRGQGRTWTINHLVLALPDRTRRQAATALCSLALERIFSLSDSPPSAGTSSKAGTRQAKNTDKVLVLTEPLAQEGEKFYHELGFTRTGDAPLEEVEVGEDLTAVPVTRPDSMPHAAGAGADDVDMPMRGKRVWLEMTREEWARRHANAK